ncbi:MAG: tRNA-queuosine alpha-mannosyltransferase domain-containing protein [Anaerolineae bacterium]
MPMNILLVAPYFGGSHRAWARGYQRHTAHDVTLLTLPARFWKWRMHGGAATLAEKLQAQVGEGPTIPDVVLATDMVNLPAFLGLTRDLLGDVPVVLYCHENQLTYPLQEGEKRDLAYPMINWLSMLAADRVLFNSHFHLENWFRALPKMLKHFPDCSHQPLVSEVRARSEVLPVGCDLRALDAARPAEPGEDGVSPLILWNQRWEYDKDPTTFFRALDVLVARGVDFRVALAGSNVRQQPEEFEAARKRLGDRVVHFGRADRAEYQQLLWEADVVVSTAIHEFFGIAMVEAIACGCFPVLPERLAYPELIPEAEVSPEVRRRCFYSGFDELMARLTWALTEIDAARSLTPPLQRSVRRFDWSMMAPRYDAVMVEVGRRS